MKKITTMLALVISASLSAMAGDSVTDSLVTDTFNKEFTGAQETTWVRKQDGYQVTFYYGDKFFTAYYNRKGYRLGITRNLLTTELPGYLQDELKESYSQYWVSGLVELSDHMGTGYYLSLENASEKIYLKSDGKNSWEFLESL